jgi:WhiB family transcriptional regulator, redox-sensing transcriptional regulator
MTVGVPTVRMGGASVPADRHDDWRDQAACSGMDVDLFYPERGATAPEAKRICRWCPVRIECLNYALRTDERYGVWGV